MQYHLRALALVLLAAIPAKPDDRLKLADLIDEALKHNPELQSAQKRVEAARQRPRQEGALPDPMLSVGYASSGSPVPGAGIGREPTANAGFMITQELPYPGKRRLMSGLASKEADAVLEQYLITERSIISRVKQAFHRLNHSYEALEVMHRSQDLLIRFIDTAKLRYSAGKAMQQDIFKAQSQLAIMETRIVKMRQDLAVAQAELNAILHRPIDSPLAQPNHQAPLALVKTVAELTAGAERDYPMITREQKMTEARQIGVSLARKNFYPDFAVSGGYYNMGTMPDMYQFRLDIKVPVSRVRQRAALTEQVQSLEQARLTLEATMHEARWRVNELYITAQTSWRLIELYKDSVMPQSELAVESSLASYQTGAADSMPVLMNLMTRVEQEERYHEEMLSYFLAVVRLEEITGLELQ